MADLEKFQRRGAAAQAAADAVIGKYDPSRCLGVANKCDGEPVYRFTWPGQPEAFACLGCGSRALRVATAMGFELQLYSHVATIGVRASRCDHKFIDSKRCLKCGWTP